MPFVEEDDLVKLYDEIENLSKKEEELRKGYIDLKLLNNKIANNRKFRVAIILLLIVVALFLTYLIYTYKKEAGEQLNKEIVLKKKLDSLANNVANTTSKNINKKEKVVATTEEKPIFSIQIGTFKKLKIHPSTVKGGLKKVINKDASYTYTIGEFSDFKQALVFKNQIQNLDIKDAFMVAYYKGEKISLKRALRLNKKKSN